MSYFDDASLVMIPSSYKTSKVYSVKPTDGTGDLTFSRSNDTATRVNSAGLIEKVRTNVLTYSQDFSNANWVGFDVTRTGSQTDPNGGTTASLYTSLTSSANVTANFSTASSSPYTLSIYIKGTSSGSVSLRVDSPSLAPVNIINYTTSWQRFTYTFTAGASTSTIVLGGYASFTPSEGIYVAFAQAELGDIATDYIATTSAAVSVGPVANVPRLDYLNSSCPRLLLEPQRTNLAQYSEQFDNVYFSKVNAAINANALISPDGYTNADKFVATATTGVHYLGVNVTSASPAVLSVFAKAAEETVFAIGNATGSSGVVFNLSNGTITSGTGGTIENYGNGWYRCSYYRTSWTDFQYFSLRGNVPSYTGNGTDGIYIYGVQFEVGAYATSYIPTLGASVTRGVDFGSSSNTIGTSYSSSDFSYFIEFDLLQDSGTSNSPMLFGGGNSALGASYQGYFRLGLSGNNSMILFGHGDSLMASVVYAFTKGTRYKLLVKRSGTSIKFYVNGAQVGATGTSSLDFTLRSIGWSYAAGSYNTYGNIYQFLAFQTALSDADAIALTA